MFRRILLCTLALALAITAGAIAETEQYGAGVDLPTTTPIGEIVADPDAWVDKTVRVEGTVAGVCAKKGCWMELESREGDHLRVKVEDDVIVFPAEAEGRWAVAQGTVQVNDLTREQYADWLRHIAEEQGGTFDEAAVGDGPYRLVQIKGTGAEIGTESPAEG